MFLGIQIALVVVGLFVLVRGRFDIGGREVGNPMASLVGIVLIGQLPLALLVGIVLSLTAEPAAPAFVVPTRAGSSTPAVAVAGPRAADENWWVDPLITCTAVLAAGGLTGLALRSAEETDVVLAHLSSTNTDAAP
jgi:hypothetical protein